MESAGGKVNSAFTETASLHKLIIIQRNRKNAAEGLGLSNFRGDEEHVGVQGVLDRASGEGKGRK